MSVFPTYFQHEQLLTKCQEGLSGWWFSESDLPGIFRDQPQPQVRNQTAQQRPTPDVLKYALCLASYAAQIVWEQSLAVSEERQQRQWSGAKVAGDALEQGALGSRCSAQSGCRSIESRSPSPAVGNPVQRRTGEPSGTLGAADGGVSSSRIGRWWAYDDHKQ